MNKLLKPAIGIRIKTHAQSLIAYLTSIKALIHIRAGLASGLTDFLVCTGAFLLTDDVGERTVGYGEF